MATKKTTTKEEVTVENRLIVAPRITEKASLQSNANAYTFVVKNEATKLGLIDEIKKVYKVTPKKVTITNTPATKVFVRGAWGTKAGMKKAVVFLKKGDSIAIA